MNKALRNSLIVALILLLPLASWIVVHRTHSRNALAAYQA